MRITRVLTIFFSGEWVNVGEWGQVYFLNMG